MYWKRPWPRRSSARTKHAKSFVSVCALLLLGCFALLAADKLKDLQDHFDKDSHAGDKVKALVRLAEAEFETANKAVQAADYVSAALTFEKYRDNVRATLELLRKQEPDADRHPGGYRALELEIRKGIREVEEVQLVAPAEIRPPLGLVHKDLIDMDDQLIHLLFPRRSKDPEKAPAVPPVPAEVKP